MDIRPMGKISAFLDRITDRISGIRAHYNSAIIVAAGSGTRCGTEGITKQMVPLAGVPVIARTVSVFESCSFIDEIIIVARPDEMGCYEEFSAEYQWKKVRAVVPGGETRQESVLAGFCAVSDKSEYVYIHDGARCLITPEMVAGVGHTACMKGAAIAAHRASDTVKSDESGRLLTADREHIWLAQTPQVFRTEMYRAAAYLAKKKGQTATDDAMLCELAGFAVEPVECGTENLKITHRIDFTIAEAILRHRAGEEKT